MVSKLSPITDEFNKIREDKAFINNILSKGAKEANEIANENLYNIKKIIGFIS